MEFDEYDYLERTVENPEPQKVRESVNGGDDTVKSGEKDRHRSSRHKSDEKDDGNDENHRAKRSRSGDENRDHERRKEGKSSRLRSRSRDGDRDRDWGSREPKDGDRSRDRDRDRDRENRNGKDGDKDREWERDRERDRPRDRKDRDRDSEREREQSRRSGSRLERHRSERDERDREKSRDRDREFREREKEREIRERDRESRKKKEEVAEPVADPERDQRTVFAYQISLKADERDVYEFFSRAGKVRDVRLIMDRNSRRSKGVGYIEFFDVMSVPMAIALSGQLLLGQPVMVKPSEAEKNLVQSTNTTTGASGAAGPYSGGARRLYVGNLHVNITEDQLRQVFESFGQVELVQLPLDEAGHCKGFGFVQFVNLEDARNALSLDGQLEIAGRKIKVSNVTDSSGMQDAGMKPADLDDDEGAGLLSNARDRALLIQKLARTDIAPSGTASLTTPMVGTGITMPTAPILGTPAALVSPAVLPILQGPVPALPGFPAGLQHPSTAVSPVDTIGVPSECLLLTNMFDPKVETEPDFDLDIKEDVEGECSKYGTLKHIYVDKNSAGFVYLRFNDTKSAISAQRSLHGRWFAGKMITATFMVPLKYEAKFPDSQ